MCKGIVNCLPMCFLNARVVFSWMSVSCMEKDFTTPPIVQK